MVGTKTTLIIFSFFLCFTLFGQADFSAATWRFIDTSVERKRNLEDVLRVVQKLRGKANLESNYFYVARCYYYEMRIADLRTEDTFYFKNSGFIDSLLLVEQLPLPLEYCLQMMQGKRLSAFSNKYKRFQRTRYERKDMPVNYAAYSDIRIDSIAGLHFKRAKNIGSTLQAVDAESALWLSSDPMQFLFRPSMYDIAIAEQISAVSRTAYLHSSLKSRAASWMTLSQDEFIRVLGELPDSLQAALPALLLYNEWVRYYNEGPGEKYFIESLARKLLYNQVKSPDNKATTDYEKYLELIAASPYSPVKAHGVYQLCILWNSQSMNYFPTGQYGYNARSGKYESKDDYDSLYQYHAVKALRLFEENSLLLDSFLYLKQILLVMEQQIRASEIQVVLDRNNLPGEPMLTEVKFRNTDTLYYRICAVNHNYSSVSSDLNQAINDLLSKKTIAENAIGLPVIGDFNYHATYLEIAGLPAGNYCLLFSGKPLVDTFQAVRSIFFNVTNIAVLNNDTRVYVLHRKTGLPLTGAKVKAADERGAGRSKTYIVNKDGFITIGNGKYKKLTVSYGGDTAYREANYRDYERYSSGGYLYDKDEYDNLVEFYEENARASIFTDRSIYRPGQVVHYKVLFLTRNRKTGEPMVMNRQNMKGKFWGNVYKKWLRNEAPWLFLYDPFGNEVDSVKIIPDEFGVVSGYFTIPKTAATGEWNIEPDYIEADWNYGEFRVEEYKKPSYEISIDKPQKELLPGDEFLFKVKVRSFAGALLGNVRISYNVSRDAALILVDSAGYTDQNGELEIMVRDSSLRKFAYSTGGEFSAWYSISAMAIDATGENYEASESMRVSTRPVNIQMPFKGTLGRFDNYSYHITTKDINAGAVAKNVDIKIYRIEEEKMLFRDRRLTKADTWIYDRPDLQNRFPDLDILQQEVRASRILVWDGVVNTGADSGFKLDPAIFVAGNYVAEVTCMERGTLRGKTTSNFSVFDDREGKLAERSYDFYHLAYNAVMPGDTVAYMYGNSESDFYSIFHLVYYNGSKKGKEEYYYEQGRRSKGLHRYTFKVPSTATGELRLTHLYISGNRLFVNEENIRISRKAEAEPEIIVEKYRKRLSPGSQETFSVSVKTKNEHTVAELMTTMYDASLDKLERHKWNKPVSPQNYRGIYLKWDRTINGTVDDLVYEEMFVYSMPVRSVSGPLWWVTPSDDISEISGDWNLPGRTRRGSQYDQFQLGNVQNNVGWLTPGHPSLFGVRRSAEYEEPVYAFYTAGYLSGRAAGMVVGADGLSDVVMIGYGIESRRGMPSAASSIRIRGANSITASYQPLILLDGVVYDGGLDQLDPATIKDALVLTGADARLYGSRGLEGVLLLSTKGEIILPGEPEPVIIPRKNFSETAFFFPAIHVDKEGYYSFSFTMPESVTEWNWKMLAHTMHAQFAYAERKLNTQLPLMVQPNMPRLLYQGDRIVLQSRITNLDSMAAAGSIVCKIEDAETGEDITGKLLVVDRNEFSVTQKGNTSSAFEIRVPVAQVNPLKIMISIRSENFVDGEEHVIPVLNPKIFVRRSLSFSLLGSDTAIQLPSLSEAADVYGIGLSIAPRPDAALIHSLPYLANYPFGCAEQTFNKLLAYLSALYMMRTDSITRYSFEQARRFVDNEKVVRDKLPDELAEEAMPWLSMSNKTVLEQRQLFELLDTSRTIKGIDDILARLYRFQNADGGLSWFNGGESDFYISSYVLRGFGQLHRDRRLIPANSFRSSFRLFIEKLVKYCDGEFMTGDRKSLDYTFYPYARGYWLDDHRLTDTLYSGIKSWLLKKWNGVDAASLHSQALLVIASLQFAVSDEDLYVKASAQLESIRQLAIEDDRNGLRWKYLADSDDLNNSAAETIVLLAEAFEAAGTNVNPGIIKWLLAAKNEYCWVNTKATAAAVNILLREKSAVAGLPRLLVVKAGDNLLTVTDDLLKGSSFEFARMASLPPSVKVSKVSSSAVQGSISWYYFASLADLNNPDSDVRITKQFYRWSEAGKVWVTFGEQELLKVADKIKVVVAIESSRALSYVYIDEKRAAAFEPLDNSSGYDYSQDFGYYKSVRDAGFHFFATFIPSGRHEISYELKVAQEGNFASGPASLQCMYKPDIIAYTNAVKISVEK